jgi:WD40 repeat protein/serine/threonine protein kinase
VSELHSEPDPLVQLAEEFAERYRRGERPSLTEYAQRYPNLAERMRRLFPALVVMEEFGSVGGPATGPHGGMVSGDSPPQLGEYRILRELARGGMGIVYEAVQESLGRHVALKVLPTHGLLSATHLERFRREARAAAKLHHTNIVPVFGVGEHEGVHYYAMQFIQGQSLDSVLHELNRLRAPERIDPKAAHAAEASTDRPVPRDDGGGAEWSASIARGLVTGHFAESPEGQRAGSVSDRIENGQLAAPASGHVTKAGPVDIPSAVSGSQSELTAQSGSQYFRGVAGVGVQVADALAYAHQQGVLHRDIKPSNLLLDTQGTVWVTDFGLAKAEGTEELTSQGDIVGTLRYMAPERFRGEADPRSDVYSLGLTLYEMLTLAPAFAASERARLIELVQHEEPARPRTLDPRIPRDLETVVLKAIAKEPGQRYGTATALAEDLRRFLADRPVQARRAAWTERAWRWCRRNPQVAGLTAAVAGLLVAATITAVWAAVQANTRAKVEAKARNDLAFNLYLRNIPRAQEEASLHNWGGVEDLLSECPSHLRGWEWNYLKRLPNAPLRDITAQVNRGISANLDLAFSPDGRLLAGPGPGNAVAVWDLTTGKPRYLEGHSGRVLCVAFRPPAGGLLASAGADGTIRFWDPTTGESVRDAVPTDARSVDGMAFSPDGKLLATVGADDWVRLWRVDTGKPLHKFKMVYGRPARLLRRVAFSPDSRHFACGGEDNAVKIWDVATGQPVQTLAGHEDLIFSVAFSPQGDRLLSASWDLTAKVWDLASGRELFCVRPSGAAWAVEFSADGRLLAVAGGVADPAVKVYDAWTGELRHTLEGHADRVGCVAFHPDGRRLASCSIDQTVRIWELERGREVLTLRGHTDLVTRVLFDPKGWRLASSSDDGKLRVWDGTPAGEASLRPCCTLAGHTDKVFDLAFSPDGRQLASASQDQTVRVWDVAAAREVRTLRGHSDTVFAVAFAADGLLSGSYDGTIKLWHARTGQPIDTRQAREARARGLALSADGKLVVSSSLTPPYQVCLWDVRQHEKALQLEKRDPPLEGHNGPAFGLAFRADGKYVATAGTDGKVILWDPATGGKKITLEKPQSRDRAWAVAFHPKDGRRLAAGYSEKRVMIWDYVAKEAKILKGHTNDVYSVAYSPDGRWLASASWHEVIIWDLATHEEIRRIGGYPGLIWTVAWSPDGRLLALAGGRKGFGEIELWDMTDLTP